MENTGEVLNQPQADAKYSQRDGLELVEKLSKYTPG